MSAFAYSLVYISILVIAHLFFLFCSGPCGGDEWTGPSALSIAMACESASRIAAAAATAAGLNPAGEASAVIKTAQQVGTAVRAGEVLAAHGRYFKSRASSISMAVAQLNLHRISIR